MKFKILLQARQWTRKRSFLRTESKIAYVPKKHIGIIQNGKRHLESDGANSFLSDQRTGLL